MGLYLGVRKCFLSIVPLTVRDQIMSIMNMTEPIKPFSVLINTTSFCDMSFSRSSGTNGRESELAGKHQFHTPVRPDNRTTPSTADNNG